VSDGVKLHPHARCLRATSVILPRVSHRFVFRRAFILAAAAALSLAACSGEKVTGLDRMIYNATYSGQGTIQRSPNGFAAGAVQPANVTMTLSQLGQDFTGTWSVALTSGQYTYSGDITGRTTSAGADFTLVQSPCAGTLYGSFTVAEDELTGSAVGRDCDAGATGNNVRITFTNLVRH
jgi:hypothetical protein